MVFTIIDTLLIWGCKSPPKESDLEKHSGGAILVFKDGVHIDTLQGAHEMKLKGYHHTSVYKVVLGQQKTHKGLTFVRQLKP